MESVPVEMKLVPHGFEIGIGGTWYAVPLDAVAAQSLALALLARPDIGGEVLPAVLESYLDARAAAAQHSRAELQKSEANYANAAN